MPQYYISPRVAFETTADAIRAKTGSSADIEWTEEGFADAINNIQNGYSIDNILSANISGDIITNVETIIGNPFRKSNIKSFSAPNAWTTDNPTAAVYRFADCTNLESVSLPVMWTQPSDYAFYRDTKLSNLIITDIVNCGTSLCEGCTALTTIVLKAMNEIFYNTCFKNCSSLTTVDVFRPNFDRGNAFNGCSSLTTFIMRYPYELTKLGNTNNFTGTPFDSGGSGGTIYIPKNLYDHLGDGTTLDYKAATNWSTLDGYGTITWAKIEGSYYETHWGDGTERPVDNLIDFTKCVDGIAMPDGTTVTSGTYLVTDFITVPNEKRIYTNITRRYTESGSWNSDQKVYWYDANKDYLNKTSTLTTETVVGTTSGHYDKYAAMRPFRPDSEAKYMRILFRVGYNNVAYIGVSGSGR